MRSRRLAAIALGVLAFLAISGMLARWLQADNVERSRVVALLQAQASGDTGGIVRHLDRCAARPACVAGASDAVARLRRPGKVLVVAYDSSTAHALAGRTGTTRVVWKTPDTLTVVQCVLVRRSGNALTGVSVTLLRLTPPIPRTAAC